MKFSADAESERKFAHIRISEYFIWKLFRLPAWANFIEYFYYGNIEPKEPNSELTVKLKKKLGKLTEKEKQLTARLNGEDKELFLNYASAYIEFSNIRNSDGFISGFRLGAKFTYDTFVKR